MLWKINSKINPLELFFCNNQIIRFNVSLTIWYFSRTNLACIIHSFCFYRQSFILEWSSSAIFWFSQSWTELIQTKAQAYRSAGKCCPWYQSEKSKATFMKGRAQITVQESIPKPWLCCQISLKMWILLKTCTLLSWTFGKSHSHTCKQSVHTL